MFIHLSKVKCAYAKKCVDKWAATKEIAHTLGELNQKVVSVGGAVVSLYIDEPSAEDVRPTKDIDLSIQISSLGALEELRMVRFNRIIMQLVEITK